ncbi:4Fe-4S dicluster domain-containing protein [Desulfobacterales bacterium HSG2]|nr:4Fe-4S dicluster domain-containing protein [Desulfobacterales bacterium HSG2]
MKVIKVDKKNWADGLGKLRGDYRLFGPAKNKDGHDFKELDKGELPDFNFLNTRLSAKSMIFPQSEAMFKYSLDESEVDHHIMREVEKDYSPRAVFGIRPCDATAFLLVKRNFDTPEYKDPYWIRSYQAGVYVGLACNDPCSTCFCTTAGCGPFHEEGLDVLLVDAGDHFLAKVLTEKGKELARAAGWTAEADVDIGPMKQTAESKISSSVNTDKLRERVTTELYQAPFWEEAAFACINCGTCTYSCPTCWCFDIQDENHKNSGIRMRNWDSCMYPLFTLHGTGHNPRETKVHRVRQRFMHKLKYYVDKYDAGIQCVGCGRCVRLCPVNIDIRKVCELMNSYEG